MPATQPAPLSVIGKAQPRIDGPLKVSGKAMYTSDHHFPGMAYAVPVCSTIANGEIQKIDTSAAEKMAGVRAIFVRNNIGKLFRASEGVAFDAEMSHLDETRPPLEDDVIRYYGQYVALAVADTFEQASAATPRRRSVRQGYRWIRPTTCRPRLTIPSSCMHPSPSGMARALRCTKRRKVWSTIAT